MKNYYIELIEKTAEEQVMEDNHTYIGRDRILPNIKRGIPSAIGGIASSALQAKGMYGAGRIANLAGNGATVGLVTKAVKDQFEREGLTPRKRDYAMAVAAPFSTPESRVKRAKRDRAKLQLKQE